MSKNKNDKNRSFEEKILDSFPEDILPDYKPEEMDPLTDSFADIVKASGVRTLVDKMTRDEDQRQAMHVFLDGLIQKQSPIFESMRESLKDNKTRRNLLLEIARATGKNVK